MRASTGVEQAAAGDDVAASPGGKGRVPRGRLWGVSGRLARQSGLVLVVIIMVGVFGAMRPLFLGGTNLENIVIGASAVAILAIGETFVIMTAGIDLSIGGMLALAAVCGALVSKSEPVGVAVLAALVVGAGAGLINGLLVSFTGITPFIITLGTMSIYSGMALVVAQGETVYGLPQGLSTVLAGQIASIPIPIIVMVVVTALGAFSLKYTRFGEYIVAIGGNAEVARLAGIRTRWYTIGAYVVCGFMAGLAGISLVALLGAADPTMGSDLLLTAIAASVMGGANLMGGEGSIVGAAVGAILLQTLTSGLTSLNVQAFWQQVGVGLAIIVALLVNRAVRQRR